MPIRIEPFRAIRLHETEELSLTSFLGASPSDNITVAELFDTDRRAADRSRYVGAMRAAAAVARWRRQDILRSDPTPAFYQWQMSDALALAGLVSVEDLPETPPPSFATKEEKAGLEAAGVMIGLPAIRCDQLPVWERRKLAGTSDGQLSISNGEFMEVDPPVAFLEGQELVGAFRLIVAERRIKGARIAVWLVAGDVPPPPGLLFWPWAEEMAGLKR